MIIVFRSVFHEESKYYVQIFLDKFLYKLQMLEHDGLMCLKILVDVSKDYANKKMVCVSVLLVFTGAFLR